MNNQVVQMFLESQQNYKWGSEYGSFSVKIDDNGNVTEVQFTGPGATLPYFTIYLVSEVDALKRGEDEALVRYFSDSNLKKMDYMSSKAGEAGIDFADGVGFTAIEMLYLIGVRGVNTHHQKRHTLDIDC